MSTKICMIVRNEFKPDMRVLKEAKSLKKHGYDVEIIAIKKIPPDKVTARNLREIAQETVQGIKVTRVPLIERELLLNLVSPLYYLYAVPKLIRAALKTNSEVYHCHDLNTLPCGFLIRLFTSNKVLYDSHEDYPSLTASSKSFPKKAKGLIESYIKFLEIFLLFPLKDMITRCDILKKYYSSYGKNVVVLFNSPEQRKYNKAIRSKKLEQKYRNNIVVVHESVINVKRGLLLLYEALPILRKKLPKAKVVIIGYINEQDEIPTKYAEFIKRHNLSANFEVTGWVDNYDIPKYLNLSKVGLILFQPTHYNMIIGSPNKLFSYMACEVPIVSTDMLGPRTVISKHNCGLIVNHKDPQELANAIIKIITDAKLSKKLGKNGLQAYKKYYAWEVQEKKLVELYDRLTKK